MNSSKLSRFGQQVKQFAAQFLQSGRELLGAIIPLAELEQWVREVAGVNYLVRRVASRRNVTRPVVVVFRLVVQLLGWRLWACGRRLRRWATQADLARAPEVRCAGPILCLETSRELSHLLLICTGYRNSGALSIDLKSDAADERVSADAPTSYRITQQPRAARVGP